VAAGGGFEGLLVVLDVVGLEALVAVVDVDVVIGDEEVAFFLLRAAGPDFDVSGLAAGVHTNLLGGGGGLRLGAEKIEERSE
jgi:hypothetical protein